MASESSDIRFLSSPTEFYNTLISLFGKAERRVSIATLYVGTGDKERVLLQSIPGNVEVKILIDGLRGTRKDSPDSSTSVQMIEQYCSNATIFQYLSPSANYLVRFVVPARINEVFGTQHMKLIAVDDTVVITGANLSDTYFTNRQDRYLVVKGIAGLAEYVHAVIDRVGRTSSSNPGDLSANLVKDVAAGLSYRSACMEASVQYSSADSTAMELLKTHLTNQDSQSELVLASPYLNLSPDIISLLSRVSNVRIVSASPRTNAFHNSKGVSSYIPAAYACIEQDLRKKLSNAKFFHYSGPPGWSFHCKGIWSIRNKSVETIIGSSNFGMRSSVRDLEISFRLKGGTNMLAELNNIKRNLMPVCFPSAKAPLVVKMLAKGPLRTFL